MIPLGTQCAAAGAGKIGLGKHGGIVFKHRSAADREIYFLSNTSDQAAEFIASLRAGGRRPELWNADSGKIIRAAALSQQGGRKLVQLRLAPSESIFIVLSGKIATEVSGSAVSNNPGYDIAATLDGPWTVLEPGEAGVKQTR